MSANDPHLTITISGMNNAAFEDAGRDYELSRILRDLANKIEDRGIAKASDLPLYDINGNKVGELSYYPGED